jgi:hypothetical protein
LASGTGDAKVPDEFVFICTRTNSSSECSINPSTGEPDEGDIYAKKKKFIFAIGWTRFGDVAIERWGQKMVNGVAIAGKWTEM